MISTILVRQLGNLLILGMCALLLVLACGKSESRQPDTIQTPTAASKISAPENIQVLLASTDVSVGANRIVFGLMDNQGGLLRDVDIEVSTFYLSQKGLLEPIETLDAMFRRWPSSNGGVYTITAAFDKPGEWGLAMKIVDSKPQPLFSSVAIQVSEFSKTPSVGSIAPSSINKTTDKVASIDHITSDLQPDLDLYKITISEAINSGIPSVVIFATPAFCSTSTCGPQVKVLKMLKDTYSDIANFIHVEVWDNPHEIDGNIANGILSPLLDEWGIQTEPWSFVLDGQGIVSSKFEGFATEQELSEALKTTLFETLIENPKKQD